MQIKSILAAAAIAIAASVGSAYAADQFTTLEGVQAQPMIAAAMEVVRGAAGVDLTSVGITTGGVVSSGFITDLKQITGNFCGCDVVVPSPQGP